MTLRRSALLVALTFISLIPLQITRAEEKPAALAYDPAVSTLTGTLISMKLENDEAPALKGATVWIFRPDQPISLKANPENELDEAESEIKDVQLAFGEKAIDPATLAKFVSGKTRLTAKGKLFHGHTVHHVTKVLMMVSELKPVDPPAKKE